MTIERAALGFLQVGQSEVATDARLVGPYDLAIATVSWESRCSTASLLLKASGAHVTLFRFASTAGETSKRKDDQYSKMAASLGDKHSVLDLEPSLRFDENARRIEALVRDAFAKVQRPIRVLLDASCIPKRYLLFMIGLGFRREYVCGFDILYAEGNYDLPTVPRLPRVSSPRGLVSEGEWTSVQVPFLESSDYAPPKRDLCISAGAEISVALPLIERMDPRRVDLIEISGTDKRVPKVSHEQAALAKIKSWPNVRAKAFELHDVIGLAKHIISSRDIVTTCLAIGSKPHAIALAIAALSDDLIEVVCRAPGGYVAGEVTPTGRVYHFTIEDRFEPLSYLVAAAPAKIEAGSKPVTKPKPMTKAKASSPRDTPKKQSKKNVSD